MFLLVSGGHICAPERDTNMASPYKALKIWVKRFSEYLAYELLHRPDSWQGFLYIYLWSSFLATIEYRLWNRLIYWIHFVLSNQSQQGTEGKRLLLMSCKFKDKRVFGWVSAMFFLYIHGGHLHIPSIIYFNVLFCAPQESCKMHFVSNLT